jgi:methyl-accepting chemotaxis protein
MTRNIAASVHETTNSAVEVTKRVQQVAREAGSTGLQAQRVDDVCVDVAEHVRSLHATLVRIVRTCSVEIDRRSQQRFSFGEAIELEVHGRIFQAILSDLSAGGAKLRGRIGGEREQVRLHLPGINGGLLAQVINLSDEATHVKFLPDQPALAQLDTLLSNRRQLRSAA